MNFGFWIVNQPSDLMASGSSQDQSDQHQDQDENVELKLSFMDKIKKMCYSKEEWEAYLLQKIEKQKKKKKKLKTTETTETTETTIYPQQQKQWFCDFFSLEIDYFEAHNLKWFKNYLFKILNS